MSELARELMRKDEREQYEAYVEMGHVLDDLRDE